MGARTAQFGETAVYGFTHETTFNTIERIDQHPITQRPAIHSSTHFNNLAGDVQPHDGRQRHAYARHAASRKDIVVVERSGVHTQDDVTGTGVRIREIIFQAQLVEPTVFAQHQCFHGDPRN